MQVESRVATRIRWTYGVCFLRTRLLEDQLERAAAGSWQIADRSTVVKAAPHPPSVVLFRGRFAVEPSWSSNLAHHETGANMVSRTKERALDPLSVPALLALATPSIC